MYCVLAWGVGYARVRVEDDPPLVAGQGVVGGPRTGAAQPGHVAVLPVLLELEPEVVVRAGAGPLYPHADDFEHDLKPLSHGDVVKAVHVVLVLPRVVLRLDVAHVGDHRGVAAFKQDMVQKVGLFWFFNRFM